MTELNYSSARTKCRELGLNHKGHVIRGNFHAIQFKNLFSANFSFPIIFVGIVIYCLMNVSCATKAFHVHAVQLVAPSCLKEFPL